MAHYEVHVTVSVHVEAESPEAAADIAHELCSEVNNSDMHWVDYVFDGITGEELLKLS